MVRKPSFIGGFLFLGSGSNLRHNIWAIPHNFQNCPSQFTTIFNQLYHYLGKFIFAYLIQQNGYHLLFCRAHNLTSSA